MTNQDFVKGVDMTGVPAPTGADLNNLIEFAIPTNEGSEEVGRGMGLITTDSALNIPVVPDANANAKFKRYIWFRRPFGIAGGLIPYGWNDNNVANVTLLKWSELNVNSAAIAAVVAAANNALSTANSAVSTANIALTNVQDAVDTANAASNTANTAQTTANTALANAATAITTSNTANTNATNANNASAAALIAATTGDVAVARILTAATAGQVPEVRADGTRFSLIDRDSKLAQFQEVSAASGTDAPDSVNGTQIRILNQTIKASTFATLTGAGRITLTTGKYWVEAWAIGYAVNHQLVIRNNTTNAYLLRGSSVYGTAVNINKESRVSGFVTIAAATEDIELSHFTGAIVAKGLGRATGLLEGEIYAEINIIRLN